MVDSGTLSVSGRGAGKYTARGRSGLVPEVVIKSGVISDGNALVTRQPESSCWAQRLSPPLYV